MSLIAIEFILGFGRSLSKKSFILFGRCKPKGLLSKVGDALAQGDIEGAKNIARDIKGPVASIVYQGLLRIDQGPDVVERSVVSYGGVQSGLLERNLSWITLFIAIAPSLGFLAVIGMVQAFDDIQKAAISVHTIVAAGMKVAFITTVFGLNRSYYSADILQLQLL